MIVDSSALVAILTQEPEAERFTRAILSALKARISAATFVELSIVAEGKLGDAGIRNLDSLIQQTGLAIEPVSVEQSYIARRAWSDFGKGSHPARLNFGDCFSYALAKSLDEPLLFKGDDFSHTDIEPAIQP